MRVSQAVVQELCQMPFLSGLFSITNAFLDLWVKRKCVCTSTRISEDLYTRKTFILFALDVSKRIVQAYSVHAMCVNV